MYVSMVIVLRGKTEIIHKAALIKAIYLKMKKLTFIPEIS